MSASLCRIARPPLLRRIQDRLRINSRTKICSFAKKEVTWHINKAAAVDTAELLGRCTRRFAQNVKKNAKSLLNPEMTVRYTAGIAFQNARTKAVNPTVAIHEKAVNRLRGWLPFMLMAKRIFIYGSCLLVLFSSAGCAGVPSIRSIQGAKGKDHLLRVVYDSTIPIPDARLPDYEKLTYEVRWCGLRVGTLTTSIAGKKQYQGKDAYVLEATMKTNAFFSRIYKIEDRFVSYADAEKMYTLRHEVYRRDGKYKKDAVTEFDQLNHKAYFKNFIDTSEKTFDIPAGIHDILSACYYFMLLSLKVGDRIEYYVCNNETNYQFLGLIQPKVLIRVPAFGKKENEAFLIQPYAKLKGEKVDKGSVNAYFSCAKRRIPLLAIVKGPVFTEVTIVLSKIENYR